MKIFIDASAYLAILKPKDSNRVKALSIAQSIFSSKEELFTSYAVIGEVLTVGSARHHRQAAIDFVNDILKSKTTIIFESIELFNKAFKIFGRIKDKDVGWVDCYSFAIIESYNIEKVFTFDQDFKHYVKAKILDGD